MEEILFNTEIHSQDSQTALVKSSEAAPPGILLLPVMNAGNNASDKYDVFVRGKGERILGLTGLMGLEFLVLLDVC